MSIPDSELFNQILHKHVQNEDLLTPLYTVESSIESPEKTGEELKKVVIYQSRKKNILS